MTTRQREWIESPLIQGEDEEIVYVLDVSEWGNNPTGISVVVKDEDGADVTATVTSGSPSALTDNTIQLPTIQDLTAGTEYRVEIKFTISGSILECYGYIRAEE